jgi:hypothetical protein
MTAHVVSGRRSVGDRYENALQIGEGQPFERPEHPIL